jgi:tetratricopeptide (TPR) repeat protein
MTRQAAIWIAALIGSLLLAGCTTRFEKLMSEGQAYQRQGQLNAAIRSYEGAIETAADGWEMASALNGLSDVYFAVDRPGDGFEALNRSSKLINYCINYRTSTRQNLCVIPDALNPLSE